MEYFERLRTAHRKCTAVGLTFEVLEEFTDIDDSESLASVLRHAAVSGAAPQTRAVATRVGLGMG